MEINNYTYIVSRQLIKLYSYITQFSTVSCLWKVWEWCSLLKSGEDSFQQSAAYERFENDVAY